MKTICILGAVILAVGAAAADTVYWTRAHADPARLATDLAAYDFDLASARAGEYFDIIASAGDLAALGRERIAYDVLQVIDTTDAPPSEYTEYAEMVPILQNLANTYPNICKLYDVGNTWENREIWALKISDNVATHEADEKDILVNGNHHAREIMTVEVPLYLARNLCEKYPGDPDVKRIVDIIYGARTAATTAAASTASTSTATTITIGAKAAPATTRGLIRIAARTPSRNRRRRPSATS